ncbi:MAG: 50S ribosomal protein L23 [Pirellulaceae bacterium]|nr:MAG: 50S ribosomal protein L23 [Pirellulaceae bacterium]GIW94642.1 MAG: 50S ribosomal protein L23 [Pirellulaceae bacterium]
MTKHATDQSQQNRLPAHQIVIRPLVNEKTLMQAERYNHYTFEVHPQATKPEIKQAVEELFEVKVVEVRTQNRVGKPRRYRFRQGRTKTWKKAIVTLDKEYRISLLS